MTSIWRRGTPPARFRIAWRGYDCAEVEECLQRADADRQRLQDEVAQLSALLSRAGADSRELERLSALRRDVASCLETSVGALRTATALLGGGTSTLPATAAAKPAERSASPIPAEHLTASLRFREARVVDAPTTRPPAPAPVRGPRRFAAARLSVVGGKPAAAGAAVFVVLVFAGLMYQREPTASGIPLAAAPSAPATAARALPPAETGPASQEGAREDGLVLTVTGLRASWVNTTLDGGQRMERLLAPNETILLRATNEAILRVGDATAVSVLINNQPARPLGATGQVVTARITTDNYRKLLMN